MSHAMQWIEIYQQMIDTGSQELKILDEFSVRLAEMERLIQDVGVMTPQLRESVASMLATLRTSMLAQLKNSIEAQRSVFQSAIRKTAEMN